MQDSIAISGVIITYNEEDNIGACIESMEEIVDEIIVVDSNSTDNTVKICEEKGAIVYHHDFEGHIEQKNFAIEQASYDHILSLDADERLSEKMKTSIIEVKNNWNSLGYSFNRLNNYCGKWLRHSWYPDRKIRLWDRRLGKWGGTNPHDKVIMDEGRSILLKGDIIHYAYSSVEEHFEQVRKFAVIAANAKFQKNQKANFFVHVVLNPIFKFIKRYFIRLGFLDGYYGFIFSGLAAYVNFMKYSMLWELNRKKK